MSLPETTNNQNPKPRVVSAGTYPRDPKYYYSDGSGLIIVDGVLFKVHITLMFGPRPIAPANHWQMGGRSPMYIEDIQPMLSNSDGNAIEIHGITATQFRDYLLVLFGRPYDDRYTELITAYQVPTKHTKNLCIRYLDIATLARRFGMVKLEEWAIDALHAIFTGSAVVLAMTASEKWDSATLLRLREFTKNTKVNLSALTMIQHIVSLGSRDETVQRTRDDRINDIPCVGLYHNLKASDTEPVLFGCAFLSILSLGHRSSVWTKCLTRNDRALLYAAQVQLVDAPGALDLNLGWSSKPDPNISRQSCDSCKNRYSGGWGRGFAQCHNALGSGLPLKDVLLLAQLPIHRHALLGSVKQDSGSGLGSFVHGTCRKSPPCYITLLDSVDANIQQVFTKVASHYKKIVEEL